MKVEESKYLVAVKPLLKELLDKLLMEYSYVSILAVDSKAKGYNVSNSGIRVSADTLLGNRGFVIKVYDKKGYCEYSFNQISKESIEDISEKISKELVPISSKLPNGLVESEYTQIKEEEISFSKSTEYEISPEEKGDEAILKILSGIREKGKSIDERVIDCSVSFNYCTYTKMFLSQKKDLTQNIMWVTGGVYATATDGEEMKSYYKSYSGLCGAEKLDEMGNDIENSVSAVLELLESEPIPPGEYDCICTPEVTGMIVHEAFGHGVEMDMFVKDRALAKQYIGEYVASQIVTMHDGAAGAVETATYFFDDEGTIANDTIIIEKGVLKAGISDSQTAMHLGAIPTGNGRRESFERKAYTRMTNTYFEAGNDKLEDMISSIKYGMLLENATSGMEDPKNWGIQCMVNVAREIKDGKFTGKVYSPIVLTGYVPDLLKSITMMSDEVELGGGGFCGKGYKEWVKVSDGGPYIKAKIRLG